MKPFLSRAVVRAGTTGAIAPVDFEEEINHKTEERELGTVLKIGR